MTLHEKPCPIMGIVLFQVFTISFLIKQNVSGLILQSPRVMFSQMAFLTVKLHMLLLHNGGVALAASVK